jgi:hypothetical protein
VTQEPQPSDFESAVTQPRRSFLGELWGFLRENKKWWLLPIIAALLLLGGLVILGSTGLAPFIYTLF